MRSALATFLIIGCSALVTAVLEKKELPSPPFPVHASRRTDLAPGQHALSQPPLNEYALVGQTVYLICVATIAPPTARILWYEFVSTGTGQVVSDNGLVLPSHPNAARYRIVQNEPTEFFLEITNVQLSDGGSYACADIQSGPPQVYSGQAELVVLQSHPSYTTILPGGGVVLEGQNFTSNVQLYYRGGLPPTVTWTGPGTWLLADITTPDEVFSGILFTIDRSVDGRGHLVTTNFTAPATVPPGLAGNAPNYEDIFQFGQMFVYWGPKNTFAVPMKPEYEVGENVTCHSDAYPAAFYQWQNMDTLDFFNDQVFTVLPTFVGRNNTLRCQAQNLIQGFLHSETYFIPVYVPGPTTQAPPTTTPITTTPMPDGACFDLTGWWLSDSPYPYAELYLLVVGQTNGQVVGYMRNDTDQSWVEVVGRTRNADYNFVGLTAIWPYEMGVTGMAAECHRCSGLETLHTAGSWRAVSDSDACGDGGTPQPHTSYAFQRIGIGIGPLKGNTPMDRPGFKVFKPTKLVSGKFGIQHA